MAKSQDRIKAEQVVDRYVDWLFSSDSDAGWLGDSIIGRMADFLGDLPASSGFYGVDKVGSQIWMIGYMSDDTRRAVALVRLLPKMLHDAVVIDRALRNRTKSSADPHTGERHEVTWTDAAIAHAMGVGTGTLRAAITEGYVMLCDMIEPKHNMRA